MGFYSQVIFPRLMDWSMSGSGLARYRQEVLAEVRGDVLEIGFGTGLNLPYYPPDVQEITVIDPNAGMSALAQKRISHSNIQVHRQVLKGEELPMPDASFDSVVSTWTLCSIADLDRALQQIYRVLKPGGKFFFVEHGLSDDPKVQVWQNRLTPVQKIVADGCHLNRNMQQLVESQGFKLLKLERFYAEDLPKFIGYLYKGIAVKPG
ncbi:methyltransferase domain-containing protein [Leptolyngbya sp. FACHB-261]|uniref:class I SAM-dependent methyltransferase n=1 Tax=Leptolyngbya sp. FACHB-261 TaxID=2692806 RepID=UPI0016885F88|nr:methyltransferase domain-containing protein [Leptolyngbya sp. FACHB-261]MBD2099556.1 class I SAM-dependent methyltransferase [Leptolyngbya sp. FACHB-261]